MNLQTQNLKPAGSCKCGCQRCYDLNGIYFYEEELYNGAAWSSSLLHESQLGQTLDGVDGFRAVVERHLEVEVTGFNLDGQPIKVDASGWQARIFQHECEHLDGTLYVDKMVPRTFRTVNNLDLPLATGCPKLGVR